jgi:signal peptidase I
MNTAKIFAVICLASATCVASFQILMIFRGNLSFNTLVPFIGVNGAVIGGLFYLGLDAITIAQPESQASKKILLVRDKAGRVLSISKAGGEAPSAFPSKKPLELPKVDRKNQVIGLSKSIMGLGLVFLAFLGFIQYSGTFTPLLIVQTESMEPTIMTGEMIWIRGIAPTDVNVGDIITFNIPESLVKAGVATEASTITHRVTAILYAADGSVSFKTKGDNNPIEDLWTVTSDMLVGKYEMELPYLGPIFTSIRTPMGIVTLLAVVVLIVGLPELKKYGGFSDV